MAKTAYLVTISPRTRVIADPNDFRNEDDLYDYLIQKARENMMSDPKGYLCGDNGEYEEDTECPYGTFSEDK